MSSYKVKAYTRTRIRVADVEGEPRKLDEFYSVEQLEGEPLEHKIERIVNNNEPITDGAPIIYTDRKDGVQPAYNIRTDRWEVATDAMDKVHKSKVAKRENKPVEKDVKTEEKNPKKEGGSSETEVV